MNAIDTRFFLFLNGMHAPYWDTFMYTFSQMEVWIPFYAVLLYQIIRIGRKESLWVVLALVLCIVLADQISSGLIKHWVQRLRPTHADGLREWVHTVNGYRGGLYGFVSSHAANTFALALFCTLLFRNARYAWTLFPWAAVTSYSRIYLGVHYPGDILGGILVGLFSAGLCFFLLKRLRPQCIVPFGKNAPECPSIKFNNCIALMPLGVLLFTVVCIAVYAALV